MSDRDFQAVRGELADAVTIDYRRVSRLLQDCEAEKTRIALMGNVTLDPLTPFLMVEAARVGRMTAFDVAPFGQYMQHLHSGALKAFAPDIILLVVAPDRMRQAAFEQFHRLSIEDRHALRDGIIAGIGDWVGAALAQTQATLLIGNFIAPQASLGIADLTDDYGEAEFFLDLNLALMRAMRPHARVQILDLARAAARVGTRQAFDRRLFYLARTSWTEAMMREVAGLFARNLVGALGLSRKCLVLDLDNSLWGGVIGEDGPHGIRIGEGDMIGEAYKAFQLRVRDLKHRGILLALCSKNNPDDVEELFRVRTDMPLQLSDISAHAIGWEEKYRGIEKIAHSLNIGLDAMVFMDDNPAEIATVKAHCPDVECVLLPRDPADYVAVLDGLFSFEKPRLTADDARKADHYALSVQRSAAAGSQDPMDYLRDLEMRAVIRPAAASDLLRAHQLFTKTNQFNLTTQRLSLAQVEQLIAAEDSQLIVAHLRDRFGDLGMVALYVLHDDSEQMDIAHFLMSCRAMGRGLEAAMMNDAKRRFMAQRERASLYGLYRPTPKNAPVSRFYPDQGFGLSATEEIVRYRLDRQDVRYADCGWISVEDAS